MNETNLILDRIIMGSLFGFVAFSLFSISLTQIACGLGGLAWITKVIINHSHKELHLPLKYPLLAFSLACILAVATAIDPENSFPSLKRLLEILIFFWAVNTIGNETLRNRLILVLILAGALSTFSGFYQVSQLGFGTNSRAEGSMSVYMTFAGLLMMVGLLALSRLLFIEPVNKWVALGFFLITLCLVLTYARQAWLGFLAGTILLVWFRKKILLAAIPVLIGLIFVLSPWELQDRYKSMLDLKDRNLTIRLALWDSGLRAFADYPVTGCGFKCMDKIYSRYPDPTGFLERMRGLHNNFIQLAVDTGILGVGSWIAIWVAYFMALYKKISASNRDQPEYAVAMGSLAAMSGFLVGGIFEVNFYDSEVSMLMYFIMALPFASEPNKMKETIKR
ncbi:MAG: hypothetical protein G3M78_00975 [Candidatus Nitrohelix vancouverensis]|uniref:O-antigen ligase-related domain-containing protein n=1 Tax=Candidatus Nitrohelix vancouverensis TaxID=2705534 RepID=A0A7T0G2B0_9BACT|nr:MAG: hypothetical protein G3M78_00975 [Candidatus Nitrohelix vancouverensis]